MFLPMPILSFIIPLLVLTLSTLLLVLLRCMDSRPLLRLAAKEGAAQLPPTVINGRSRTLAPNDSSSPLRASVVVVSEDDGWWLERRLPYLLRQRFEGFEVIVADASTDAEDDTALVVRRLQGEHPHLRYLSIPTSHRNIAPRRLALTLALRAARAPWMVVITPNGEPTSENWLAHLARHFDADTDLVIGYANYDDSLGSPGRRAVVERAERFVQWTAAWAQGHVLGCDDDHVALRRAWVLEHGAFADSGRMGHGACTLLAGARAEAARTAVCLHPDALVRIALPDGELLRQERRRQRQLFTHYTRRYHRILVRVRMAVAAYYAVLLAAIAFVTVRLVHFFGGHYPTLRTLGLDLPVRIPTYHWSDLAFDLPAAILCCTALTVLVCSFRQCLTALQERNFGLYPLLFFLRAWRR